MASLSCPCPRGPAWQRQHCHHDSTTTCMLRILRDAQLYHFCARNGTHQHTYAVDCVHMPPATPGSGSPTHSIDGTTPNGHRPFPRGRPLLDPWGNPVLDQQLLASGHTSKPFPQPLNIRLRLPQPERTLPHHGSKLHLKEPCGQFHTVTSSHQDTHTAVLAAMSGTDHNTTCLVAVPFQAQIEQRAHKTTST